MFTFNRRLTSEATLFYSAFPRFFKKNATTFVAAAVLSLMGTTAAWAQVTTQAPRLSASHNFVHSQGFPNSGKPANVDNSWLTSADDARLNAGVQIQRTHVTERTEYYMPGSEKELVPFADFPIVRPSQGSKSGESYSYYLEEYLRWYNYATDKADDRLTFKPIKVYGNANPVGVVDGAEHTYTRNGTETYDQNQGVLLESGYYGGSYLTGIRNSSGRAYNVTKLNGNIATYSIPAQAELMPDAHIAFDLSRGGVGVKDYDLTIDNTTLTEPILTFRLIWTLKDARPWADAFSSSKAANEAYMKSHVHRVTARANTFFQVRLEHPEPISTANPTDYWYKKSDGTYAQVYRYRVETWRDGQLVAHWRTTSTTTTLPTVVAGGLTPEQCAYNCKPTEDKLLNQNRFLAIRNPLPGQYTIKIFALDASSKQLKTADGAAYLQLEEYELTFVDEGSATLLLERDLIANHPEQTKEHLKSLYGEPRAIEDFDEYVPMDADGNYINSYSSPYTQSTYNHTERNADYSRAYHWPIPWEKTSYGRTLSRAQGSYGGHNVYAFINYTAPVFSQNGANFTGQGYDRLYYDTGGGLNVGPDDYKPNGGDLKADGSGNIPSIVKNPDAAKHGWMLWVNAAGDPGRIIDLDMGRDICVGSRIHVSAWMMETSNAAETANLMFKFYGVQPDGTEELLNTYVSGYIPGGDGASTHPGSWAPNNQPNDNKWNDELKKWNKGQWMHVYYNFTADASMTSAGYDHFMVTLENNCTHSSGADLCVDDIEVFLETPSVEVQETEPICALTSNHVKVNANFDRLLASQGMEEILTAPADEAEKSAITYTTWYCFVDKANYEAALDLDHNPNPTTALYEAAFYAALVGDATVDPAEFPELYPYHHATFYTYYDLHDDYSFSNLVNNDLAVDDVAWKEMQDGKRYLVFNTSLTNANLKPGREYLVFFRPDKAQGVIDDAFQQYVREHPVSFFEVDNKCVIYDNFIVTASNLIKVDGEPHPLDGDKISVCAGERPNIRVDMVGVNKENLEHVLDTDFVFDWYYSSYENFTVNVKTADNSKTLSEALAAFRANYPDSDTPNVPAKTVGEGLDAISYTEADKALLMKLVAEQRLELLRQSTNVDIPNTRGMEYHMVIIPVLREMLTPNILYCLNPQEVVFVASDIAPTATDGFGDMREYAMDDVPVRINLKQLDAVRASSGHKLVIPIYNANPTDDDEKIKFTVQEGNTSLVLVDTNDPAYRDAVIPDPDEIYPTAVRLPEVGNLVDVDIQMGRTPSKWHRHKENCITINFADDFSPREGYFYTLKAKFVEVPNDVNPSCPGDIIIPFKIVPLYQKWTGAAGNDDWNNDLNWTRADRSADGDGNDLMYDGADAVYSAYATNAENGTSFCYAPMRDTRVQMQEGVANFPVLYADDYMPVEEGYRQNILALGATATDDIAYDMVVSPAYLDGYTGDYTCVPYYQNNCREVHFGPDTEMLRTDLLTYDRAWVEYRFSPDRWYTIGSPLQGVYAGDMYMPTVCSLDGTTIGAQQLTPLYRDIYFDNTLATNDRFRPAVYQRGWDKAVANVYRIANDGLTPPGEANPWNVAVRGNWSFVYNDATVDYSGANGFSIKADVSRLPAANQPAEVLMRLPKADTEYIYYTVNKETDQRVTPRGAIDRSNSGRLLTDRMAGAAAMNYTITNETEGNMFLVANPFMCGLDVNTFFNRNANAGLAPKLWIVSNNTQISCVKDPTGQWVSTDGTFQDVTMLQSFFVESETADSKTLNVTFTPDMMTSMTNPDTQNAGMHFRGTVDRPSMLRIAIERDGETVSAAVVTANALAHNDYNAHEDVMLLLDDNLADQPSVYTAMDGTAMSINALNHFDVLPLGIFTPNDEAAESLMALSLTFAGTDTFGQPLYLYDAESGETTPITDDLAISVQPTATGRYFITTGIVDPESVQESDGPLYNLYGVRVATTRGEHIVIQGSRKTVVK